jgi:predicted regulator of Ras-like GTPase activity (Roadblock/LC7/MglB family)
MAPSQRSSKGSSNRGSSSSSSAATSTEQDVQHLDVEAALSELMDIDGAIGVAIVDYESGMTLGTAGGRSLDMELAGAGNTEMVRSKKNIIHDLGLDEDIEDLLVSLNTQYHLIRMCQHHADVFIYVVIDRNEGNLGLARREIDQVDERLILD